MTPSTAVRPELVEGLSFFHYAVEKKGQCFDKLSTNGFEWRVTLFELWY
jgi:hypothetical protein